MSQFVLHGNVYDHFSQGGHEYNLIGYITNVFLPQYDTVLTFDRARGIRPSRGREAWEDWLKNALPDDRTISYLRDPGPALELVDRYLLRALNLYAVKPSSLKAPPTIGIIINFADLLLSNDVRDFAVNLAVTRLLAWSMDSAIEKANVFVAIIARDLGALHKALTDNPQSVIIDVPLPSELELLDYLEVLAAGSIRELTSRSDIPIQSIARAFKGRTRLGMRRQILSHLALHDRLTDDWLASVSGAAI